MEVNKQSVVRIQQKGPRGQNFVEHNEPVIIDSEDLQKSENFLVVKKTISSQDTIKKAQKGQKN